jgi:negative regulator of sigma-B (phosphoserine phosphatase)
MGALVEYAIAARAFPGERVSGDRALVKPFSHGVLAAAVDGLGHGEAASNAAGIAIATLDGHAEEAPLALTQRCHKALRGTRGVAMSLASINAYDGMMTWLGVGNIEGLLLRVSASSPTRESLSMRGGVVGYQLPPLHAAHLPVTAGDLLFFATDGISSEFTKALSPSDPMLRHQPAQEIADRILARFRKLTDDALVLVLRYPGSAP